MALSSILLFCDFSPPLHLVPDPIRPSPEPTYAHHVVRYDEANQFVSPLTSHLRIQAGDQREPIYEGDIAIVRVGEPVRVDVAWMFVSGAPLRHPARGVLSLMPEEWGRVSYNARLGGYYGWRYGLWVFNIGLLSMPTCDVFTTRQPAKSYANMAEL